MAIYTETIPMMVGHLEEIHRAVNGAYQLLAAEDIARAARNLGGASRPSNLTKSLEKALERVEGYLTQEQVEDEPI